MLSGIILRSDRSLLCLPSAALSSAPPSVSGTVEVLPRFHSPGTIGLPTAHCSGRPPHAGSIPPTAVVDWLSVNLLPSPCLHLTILESGTLSGTTWYYHALPQTLIVWQRHFTLTSRRLFLRLRISNEMAVSIFIMV